MSDKPTQAQNIVNAVWRELSDRRGLSIDDNVQNAGIEREIYAELTKAVNAAMSGREFDPPSCLYDAEDDVFLGYPIKKE